MVLQRGCVMPQDSGDVVPILFPTLHKPDTSEDQVVILPGGIPVLLNFALRMKDDADRVFPVPYRRTEEIVWEDEPTGPYLPPNRPPDEVTETHYIWKHAGGQHVANKLEYGVKHGE